MSDSPLAEMDADPRLSYANPAGPDSLAARLLAWYEANARPMPWRGHPDPYAVWVSEIMLQQTRVETVIPYFERWMSRFPTIRSLAEAPDGDVLSLWEGLGYYSRARNLQSAARLVMERHGGALPGDPVQLRKLPGIGRYTAGAVASIAFGLDEPALDGNIRRVFARLFDFPGVADSPEGERVLWGLAREHLPHGRAGDYNQALMDLGATLCLPKNPRCLLCPLMDICAARIARTQELRPVLRPKKETPHLVYAAAVIVRRGRVLLVKRPARGLLGGMWEFPNGPVKGAPGRGLAKAVQAAYGLQVRRGETLTTIDHGYTHFSVTLHAFRCYLVSSAPPSGFKWIRIKDLQDYPMGRIDRQIARKLS